MRNGTTFFGAAMGLGLLGLVGGGCASDGSADGGMAGGAHEHEAPSGGAISSWPMEPVTADTVWLGVDGMGCPMCASGVDLVLEGLDGVERAEVDLGKSGVLVTLRGDDRPSKRRLAQAVHDSGFTLTTIEPR